ncbi:MAG: serine/threonine protein kinase, partial [Flavisolibacter sp.]|nr:serine/threonine protein kinase [Flavisolibacter sp.]
MQSSYILYAELAGYRITEPIGAGGMGEVYKAYNPKLNRLAAVKILHQKELAERFKNEAYIQSSVCHPNIARLYEFAYFEGSPCIIMEYVEGHSLDAYIRQKGRLSNEEAEGILRQIASALRHLHKQDIIHRDIKPQNFRIQPDGTVKMLDFGIAKNKYTPRLTQLGFVVGTMEYMAPEQFLEQVRIESDIWSLGVLAYEMVTGYLPFEATNPITLRSKIVKASFTHPRVLVPHISKELCIIIDKSLQVHPENRIPAERMEALLNGKRKEEPPAVHSVSTLPYVFREKWVYTSGGV